MKKILVCGSKSFDDYELLEFTLDRYLDGDNKGVAIVSGHDTGADLLGEQYANQRGIPLELFIPNFDLYGSSAEILRNVRMSEEADECIAFIDKDSDSKMTKNLISIMDLKGKKITIIGGENFESCIII